MPKAPPRGGVGQATHKIEARLKKGAELATLEIGADPHPWREFAGMFKGDPWIEDWKRSIEEYRKQVDEDPNTL